VKLSIIAILLLASISQASVCKSENGTLALIFRDSSLLTVCNPTAGKSSKEVCANDLFLITSSATTNSTTLQTIYTSLESNSTVTTIFSKQLITVEFSANYSAKSYEGGNTITAPIGKFKLICD